MKSKSRSKKKKPLTKAQLAERAERDRRARKRRAHDRLVLGQTGRNDRRLRGERRSEN
jgi:hypothetical protein